MDDPYQLREVVADDARLRRFNQFMSPAGLVVGGRVTPHWMQDGASFWYVEGAPTETRLMRVDGDTGQVAPLIDAGRTRNAMVALLGRELPYRGLPFDSIIELGGGRYQFTFEGNDYVLSVGSYVVERAAGDSANSTYRTMLTRMLGTDRAKALRSYPRPRRTGEAMLVTEAPSPDGRWFASVKDGNIMLRAAVDDRMIPLTTDGTPEIAWDIEAPRPAPGVLGQLRQVMLDPWSPDGNALFAIKADRRAVTVFPLVRYLKREEELCPVRITRAGGPMEIARPHVIDVLSRRVVAFELGDTEDFYFTLIGWLPDQSEVLFSRHSRDFKTVDVLAGDPLSGKARTVLSETASTFVAQLHDVMYYGDNHLVVLPDGSGLIWRSARSGWNHLYLYALDGTLIRSLTQGDYPVVDVVTVDTKGSWIYFTAHPDQNRPYDTHLCRVRMSGEDMQRLTPLDGENIAFMSPSKKTFTVINSRPDRPFRTDFHACDGRRLAQVQRADVSALDEIGNVASEQFTVLAADGESVLWGVMHKPADFDPNKKYPIIDHLYGGPQTVHASHHFGFGEHSFWQLDRALAQLGYIVITMDARGTPERSKAFHDVVYRNWGRHEIPDHAGAIRQLGRRHAFIDTTRVGVWGHSWGGYFTIRALAQAADVFHVGVAVAPGTDPYDLILYEPYLDLPTRAKAAYDYANNAPLAAQIEGKLMMIVGTSDPVCYSNTLEMAHYLIAAGIEHELVVIPEANHYFLGNEDRYFVRKLVKHFETQLKSRASR